MYSPYGAQRILITLQILACVTLFVSIIGWWLTWFTGVASVILIMLLACCTVDVSIVIVAGILAVVASISQFILSTRTYSIAVSCKINSFPSSSNFQSCDQAAKTVHAVAVATGVAWSVVALLTFSLVCVLKDKRDRSLRAWGGDRSSQLPRVVIPPAMQQQQQHQDVETASTKITELPDGGRRIEETVLHADGSKTVTVTVVEAPPPPTVDAVHVVAY